MIIVNFLYKNIGLVYSIDLKLSRLVWYNFFGERQLQNELYMITDNSYVYIKLGFRSLDINLIEYSNRYFALINRRN